MRKMSNQEAARQREELLQFESVKRWMSRETIRASTTKYSYMHYLTILLNHLGCNPDESAAQRIESNY